MFRCVGGEPLQAILVKTASPKSGPYKHKTFPLAPKQKTSLTEGQPFFGEITPEETIRVLQLLPQQDRVLPQEGGPQTLVGAIVQEKERLFFVTTDRKGSLSLPLPAQAPYTDHLNHYVRMAFDETGATPPKLVADLGAFNNVTALVIQHHNLRTDFPKDILKSVPQMTVPKAGPHRKDIQDLDFVTIDGEDAKDFDDAVHAHFDAQKKIWTLTVAIADVSYYVPQNSALDKEALARGNSVYLPGTVLPMLPEALSNDLCSLVPHKPRAALCCEMKVTADGQLLSQRFFQGIICSKARLTYSQVDAYQQGQKEECPAAVHGALDALIAAHEALKLQRAKRAPLAIHSTELGVEFDAHHRVKNLIPRAELASHQLIEDFMILANEAAALFLQSKKQPAIYRTHATPTPEKAEPLTDFLRHHKIKVPKHLDQPHLFNQLFHKLPQELHQPANELVLRSQMKAVYAPQNLGHFGLNLENYCHFTSPIRRYADLVVHRAIVAQIRDIQRTPALSQKRLAEVAQHISETERQAVAAEREAIDRYATLYFQDKVGDVFKGYVSGISPAGIFISLDHMGISGLVPMELLLDDYYMLKQNPAHLKGRRTGRTFYLGTRMDVMLESADVIRGRLRFCIPGDSPFEGRPRPGKRPGKRSHHRGSKRPGHAPKKEGIKKPSSPGSKTHGKPTGKPSSSRPKRPTLSLKK